MQEPYPATVFIIDDDPLTLGLITKALKGLCQLKVSTQPLQALKLMEQSPPDLVLSDVNMPEFNGYELLTAMKNSDHIAHIPIIFLTGLSNHSDEQKGLELGAVDYVSKPINPAILRARVRSQLLLQLSLRQESQLRQQTDQLLEVILPLSIAQELKTSGSVEAKSHEAVAVIFCDVVGFTEYSQKHPATKVVERLDALFKEYEKIASYYQVEKIKTIGDAFMATAGLNIKPRFDDPLLAASLAALEMCTVTPKITPDWSARAGVYIGPLVSGIVGDLRYQFDVWGNTVNVAARLCGVSAPHTIAVTQQHALALQNAIKTNSDLPTLSTKSLGPTPLKGLQDIEIIEISKL